VTDIRELVTDIRERDGAWMSAVSAASINTPLATTRSKMSSRSLCGLNPACLRSQATAGAVFQRE